MDKKMKYFVLGAGGMAGHVISTYLLEKGHSVIGFDKIKIKHCKSIEGDVRNLDFLRSVIEENEFDTIINCIGILNQFAENNKELAVFLNSYLPHLLVDLTKNLPTQIIQMSTDCVFSGKRGSYSEIDFPDGETFYDRTKALGEINDKKNITLRNSIVGPDINPNGIGLLGWFMNQNSPISGYTHAMWTGLTTLELAKVMEYASQTKASGLVNMVNKSSISKYDLLGLFNKHMRGNKIKIEPFDDYKIDKSLIRTNFEMDYDIPDYDKMIFELAKWIADHRYYYPHYSI